MKKLFTLGVLSIYFVNVLSQTYSNTTVYTPKGEPVQAKILTSGELTNQQKTTIYNETLQNYQDIEILGAATWTYNCHGYAWHISEGGFPAVWINEYDDSFNPNVYKYFTGANTSYVQVCNESDADKIHYYYGDHSANISATSGKYESKWGGGNLVKHDPTNVPSIYNANYRRYYASTKITGSTDAICSGTRIFQ